MQGNTYDNNSIPNLTPYLAAIERFDPNSTRNFSWIPEGLPYDLMDSRDDNTRPIIDLASGFTMLQNFNALQSDVRSIPSFRIRLLQQNNNNQQTAVTQLFQQYGY